MLNAEEILRQGIEQLGLSDSNNIVHKLLIYKDILLKWNKSFNLTAMRDEKTIIIKKLLLGGGVLVLLQLINLFIYIQSIPIEILFSTIFLFLLFVSGYLKKA